MCVLCLGIASLAWTVIRLFSALFFTMFPCFQCSVCKGVCLFYWVWCTDCAQQHQLTDCFTNKWILIWFNTICPFETAVLMTNWPTEDAQGKCKCNAKTDTLCFTFSFFYLIFNVFTTKSMHLQELCLLKQCILLFSYYHFFAVTINDNCCCYWVSR